MKKIILILIVIISATVNAQTDTRKSAELYVNFAEEVMEDSDASEKSVDDAIISLRRSVEIDETYGEAYYLLGITIFKKIDYVRWNAKAKRRRGESAGNVEIQLRKLYSKSKVALEKAILYEEDSDEVRNLIRKLNFELIGERVPRRIMKVKMIENERSNILKI